MSTFGLALGLGLAAAGPGAAAKSTGGCPSSQAIGNFLNSNVVGASVTNGSGSSTYFFSSFVNLNSSGGVPGLIQYCVYPSGALPASASASAVGADGSAFGTVFGTHQGYFGFGRSTGDPSNLPLDGTMNTQMGTATWSGGVPTGQRILLHINDPQECQRLYSGGASTCFVFPGTLVCSGNVACKSVAIPEATSLSPLTVPLDTQLHFHYSYTVVNQPSNTFNMLFNFSALPGPNSIGMHDYFGGCNQTVDPNGSPGSFGTFANYEASGFNLILQHAAGSCPHAWFTMTSTNGTFVLAPGHSVTFTVDMTTIAGGLSCMGSYEINPGLQVKWYQSNDGVVHTYKTAPIVITAA